jgi:hypothetical protein
VEKEYMPGAVTIDQNGVAHGSSFRLHGVFK